MTSAIPARELATSEVARLAGVPVDVLRKWKCRGYLKLAPKGVAGQGRSIECYWSPAAVQEAIAWAARPRISRKRVLPPPSPELLTAAREALQRMDARMNEDADVWADRLAHDLAEHKD